MVHVYQLPFDLFHRAAPLFANTGYEEPFLDSVFEGIMPGQIFVDNPVAPGNALVCRTYDYFVAGRVDTPLRQFIHDAPAEPGVFQVFYGYVPCNDAWRTALMDDHGFSIIPRRNFIWQGGVPAWRQDVPTGGRVVMVDAALAERIDHDLDETIGLLWSGYAHFARHGLGMCLMIGDEIASVAFACAVSKTMSNIGVATAEAHRQKGYATLVSRAFIEESLRRGLTPTWDCDEWNTASLATARRLGLTERAPFTELGLGPYPRCKPPLSEGIWGWQAGEAGVKVWSR